MNKTSTIIVVLLLISFIPFDIFLNADEREQFQFNTVENEGYTAFIVQSTDPSETPDPPTPGPISKCECNGSKVMVHGDGHKTPCQCFNEGDGVCNCSKSGSSGENTSGSSGCQCYNNDACKCADGKCQCANCGCKADADSCDDAEACLMRDLGKLLGDEDSKPKVKLVIFSATWCGPCQAFKKYELPKLKKSFSNYEIVDVDKNRKRWSENVKLTKNGSVPQFVIEVDGQFKEFWTGNRGAKYALDRIKVYQK